LPRLQLERDLTQNRALVVVAAQFTQQKGWIRHGGSITGYRRRPVSG
jgi:hypothetical protein